MTNAVRAIGYLVAGLGLLATFAAYHGDHRGQRAGGRHGGGLVG